MLGVGMFGMQELIVVLLICLLIFGAARLPEIGRSLGKAIREFKKVGKELDDDEVPTEGRREGD
jgi:sec-independent protein translocase protein TatA